MILLDYEPGNALGGHGNRQEDVILTVEGIGFGVAFFFADFGGSGQAGVIEGKFQLGRNRGREGIIDHRQSLVF